MGSEESNASARPVDSGGHGESGLATGTDRPALAGPLLVYTALRLGLIAILTVVLALFMPLIVALAFAIILQLPLAYLLFPGPRRRVNAALAAASAQRRAERDRLRAALAGDGPGADRPVG